jgi:hypothetical protein
VWRADVSDRDDPLSRVRPGPPSREADADRSTAAGSTWGIEGRSPPPCPRTGRAARGLVLDAGTRALDVAGPASRAQLTKGVKFNCTHR